MKRLPDTELEVMKALWASGPDTTRAQLEQNLEAFRWASNTINTYLTRLVEKGFVSVRREGKTNLYTPLVEREAYVEEESRSFLERLHGGSLSSLVAALCPDTRLTEEDVAALERILGKEEG